MDWTGLDWTGLDWTGLDWTGLDSGHEKWKKTDGVWIVTVLKVLSYGRAISLVFRCALLLRIISHLN